MTRFTLALILSILLAPLAGAAELPDPAAEYAARAAKLAESKDPKAWLKLADFAEEKLLWEKRLESLKKAVEASPENAEAHARLDERKGKDAWVPAEEADAHEAEEMQAKGLVYYGAKWIPAKEAAALREADRKACGWNCEVRIDTPHFVLYGGRTLALARRLAALLENDLAAYQRFYKGVWTPQPLAKPIKVYLFGDLDTYLKKLKIDLGQPVTGFTGLYSAVTKVCYLGFASDYKPGLDPDAYIEEQTARVAAHEMVHAFDDLISRAYTASPNRLDWVLEGRADHFGLSVLGRQVLPGHAQLLVVGGSSEDTAAVLKKVLSAPALADLLAMNTARFNGAGVREHYVTAWAWTHFLFHAEGGKYAAGFRKFLSGCPKQDSAAEFEKAVGRISVLEPAFKAYAENVLLPSL